MKAGLLGAVLFLVTITSPAVALEGRLVSILPGVGSLLLWKSKATMDEGQALLRAKADAKIAMPLIACTVEVGNEGHHDGRHSGLDVFRTRWP